MYGDLAGPVIFELLPVFMPLCAPRWLIDASEFTLMLVILLGRIDDCFLLESECLTGTGPAGNLELSVVPPSKGAGAALAFILIPTLPISTD